MTLADRLTLAGPLAAIIIMVDQMSKAMILGLPALNGPDCLDRTERCGQIEVSGIFDLSMVWNRGMSFGTLQSEGIWRWALVALTLAIAGVFAWWLLQATTRLTVAALGFVVAGAIGNVIDRVRFGAVVDFLDFSGLWFPYVFNVADASITVGAALLLFDQLILSRKTDKIAT